MTSIALHFRLDPDRPDEAHAWEILMAWQNAGWDVQKIMVVALLGLQGHAIPQGASSDQQAIIAEIRGWAEEILRQTAQSSDHLQARLDELQMALGQAQNLPLSSPSDLPLPAPPEQEVIVTDDFVASLKKLKKPGMRLTDDPS